MQQDSQKRSPLNNTAAVRLQKYLAECGVGSRRACERLIASGAVSVDGDSVLDQGVRVVPGRQRICVSGREVGAQRLVYLLINKPVDVLCTSSDEAGRRTIHALLPDLGIRVYNVGRLDRQSEGLLLVTNDGDLAARLMHPRYHVGKEYLVWCTKTLSDGELQSMRDGLVCQGDCLRASEIHLDHTADDTYCYSVLLHEGKNRQIRRMFAALYVPVVRLLRVAIGPLRLEDLKPGEWRHMAEAEIRELYALTNELRDRASD